MKLTVMEVIEKMKHNNYIALALIISALLAATVFAYDTETTNVNDNVFDAQEVANALTAQIPTDEFGGLYFDESGYLIINLTYESGIKLNSLVNDQIAGAIKCTRVKYSLSELEDMKSAIEPHMLLHNITSLDSNEVTNTIDIEVSSINEGLYKLISDLNAVDPSIVRIIVQRDMHISNELATAPPYKYPTI